MIRNKMKQSEKLIRLLESREFQLEFNVGEKWFDDLKLEDSLDESNLQVNLEITYFRKTNKDGQLLMDTLATSLRNMDEDDIEITLKGGGTIKGGDLKLSGSISVQ